MKHLGKKGPSYKTKHLAAYKAADFKPVWWVG